MPTLYDIKPAFQDLLRPLVGALARRGVTANQVTVAAVVLSVLAGLAVVLTASLADTGGGLGGGLDGPARWALLAYPPVLLVRMALNAVDGMLAREHGQASRLGGLLNELGDVVADAALYLPLAIPLALPFLDAGLAGPAPPPGFDASLGPWLAAALSPALVVLLVVLAAWVELAGVAAVAIGASRRYDGPFGKSDRALLVGALTLILGLGVAPGPWLTAVLGVAVILSAWTVVQRCRRALAEARERRPTSP